MCSRATFSSIYGISDCFRWFAGSRVYWIRFRVSFSVIDGMGTWFNALAWMCGFVKNHRCISHKIGVQPKSVAHNVKLVNFQVK